MARMLTNIGEARYAPVSELDRTASPGPGGMLTSEPSLCRDATDDEECFADTVLSWITVTDDRNVLRVLEGLSLARPHLVERFVDAWLPTQIGELMVEDQKPKVQELTEARPGAEVAWANSQSPLVPLTSKESDAQATVEMDSFRRSLLGEPIIQFSSFLYYCHEDEQTLNVDVMRIGDLSRASLVGYCTVDGSAKADINYTASSGTLFFGPGEHDKVFRIPLLTTEKWDTTTEFKVQLLSQGMQNAALGRYLHHARVKVIDQDCFPSNVYETEIKCNQVETIPWFWLMWEYCKLNRQSAKIARNTYKVLMVYLVHASSTLLQLLLSVYMVDTLLEPVNPGAEMYYFGFLTSHTDAIVVLVFLSVAPTGILHALDHRKKSYYGLGGAGRHTLQMALLRKFLNYDQQARGMVKDGDLVLAMTRDATSTVRVYEIILEIMHELMHFLAMLLYQFLLPYVFEKSFNVMGMIPVIAFPTLMLLFLHCRGPITGEHLVSQIRKMDTMVGFVEETVSIYKMIAAYNQRPAVVTRLENCILDFNYAHNHAQVILHNNAYFPKWLSVLTVAAWTLYAVPRVVRGEESLGIFLATLSIFVKTGTAFSSVYALALEMKTAVPGMQRIVTLLNMPTDLMPKRHLNRLRTGTSKELLKDLMTHTLTPVPAVDRMPVMVENINFKHIATAEAGQVRQTNLNMTGSLHVRQGTMVCLVGQQGGGKSTLLRLIGGDILPDVSSLLTGCARCFMPAHLRILHIGAPMFFYGTLRDNLIFGCAHEDPDASIQRVSEICEYMGAARDVMRHLEARDCHDWSSVLSQTQCQLLSLARALIANPELLCIHRPTQGCPSRMSERIMTALSDFVARRGLAQDVKQFHRRRPRTCFVTCSDFEGVGLAHAVYHVSKEHGIEQVVKTEDRNKIAEDVAPERFGLVYDL